MTPPIHAQLPPSPFAASQFKEQAFRNLQQLPELHDRASLLKALDNYDCAEHAFDSSRSAHLAVLQICGGLAVGLFPYFPGFIENCRPKNNPGWLCGARAATMFAATGAVVVGVLAGLNVVRHRNWLRDQQNNIAISLTLQLPSSVSKTMACSALDYYAEAAPHERQRARSQISQYSPNGNHQP